jgi:transposase-like protein
MRKGRKQSRIFSEAFKREKVKLLDEGKMKVADISKIYGVSKVSVYQWLKKFSSVSADERVVVEKVSEAKKTMELYNQVRDLEQALGRKQMELDYFKKVVELASEEKGEDFEKKYKPKQ